MSEHETQFADGTEGVAKRRPGRPSNFTRRSQNNDERLTSRDADDREDYDERDEGEDEFIANFRDSLSQSNLPDLPKIPGYHVCWISTAHQSDTVQHRLRIGYELLTKDECNRDMGPNTHNTGDYADIVAVKEMLAAKIPLRLYNKYMRIAHHDAPREQEFDIRSSVEAMRQEAAVREMRLTEGDGTAGLGKGANSMPVFTE